MFSKWGCVWCLERVGTHGSSYLHHQRWAEVMFSPLSVCEQDISESCGLIQTKLGGLVGCVTRNKIDRFW